MFVGGGVFIFDHAAFGIFVPRPGIEPETAAVKLRVLPTGLLGSPSCWCLGLRWRPADWPAGHSPPVTLFSVVCEVSVVVRFLNGWKKIKKMFQSVGVHQ